MGDDYKRNLGRQKSEVKSSQKNSVELGAMGG
jgi:hypothetical protein